MFITGVYIKVHTVREKSLNILIGYHKIDEKFPLYMGTCSLKAFKESNITPIKDAEYTADIMLQKDAQFRTWIVVKGNINPL